MIDKDKLWFCHDLLNNDFSEVEKMSATDCIESSIVPSKTTILTAPGIPNTVSAICMSDSSQKNFIDVRAVLQKIRDNLSAFQERSGIPRDENDFIGLILIIIQQASQAMYAVFMLFLALFRIITILFAIIHFIVERLVTVITSKTQADAYIRLGILCMQLLVIYLMTQFVLSNIFSPIFTMQVNIISKMIMITRGSLINEIAMKNDKLSNS